MNASEEFTAYVTTWVLTKGIAEVKGKLNSDGFFCFTHDGIHYGAPKSDWHKTHEEAKTRAKEMIEKEIVKLNRKIDRMNFELSTYKN